MSTFRIVAPVFKLALPAMVWAVQLGTLPDSRADWREDVGFKSESRESLPLVTYVARGDSGWSFRKGLSEPTSDPAAWRARTFHEDASWQLATAPIGYGDGDDATLLSDMRRSYSSLYLRKTFFVGEEVPSALLLRLYVDDGAVIWINGREVVRRHVPEGELSHSATAAINEASWERALLTGCDEYLVSGENSLAVHAFNQSVTSSDFSIDLELVSPRVSVMQVESPDKVEFPPGSEEFISRFLPQAFPPAADGGPFAVVPPGLGESFAGEGNFSRQQFAIWSSSDSLYYSAASGHATMVGNFLYGSSNSLYPSLPEVKLYETGEWLERVVGGTGGAPPLVEDAWIQNHSWVALADEETSIEEWEDAAARIDHFIDRDGVICVVGLNNGAATTVPPLMATAFNVISVGNSSGTHSRGGTTGEFSQPGRIRPDIVAPQSTTSWSTASISSAAALLLDEVLSRPENRLDAARPQVMKAILLSGATTVEFPAWSRSPTVPMDVVYGAGELDVANSQRILRGGPANTEVPLSSGWALGTATPGVTSSFKFHVPAEAFVSRFKATICWHREVENALTNGSFEPAVSLADLSLMLVDTTGQEIASSVAKIGTVEHLSLSMLPSGNYTLEVTTDQLVDFGIAWDLESEVSTPRDSLIPSIRFIIAGEEVSAHLLNLIPARDYRLEISEDLRVWNRALEFAPTGPAMIWNPQERFPSRVFLRLLLFEE